MRLERLCFNINGVDRFITCDPETDTLAECLRRMGLTGVKVGCGTGVCGACSVILNGEVVRSCTKKMKRVPEFSTITTIEGIGTPQHLHPLQQAWITYGGAQCGFCSPGFIVSAYGLLQGVFSSIAGRVVDSYGFTPLCLTVSVLPLTSWLVLHLALRRERAG